MKILILEDEIPAYQKIAAFLATYFTTDLETFWARSIEEGKLLINANKYDLILSDIQLLDGISFDLFHTQEIDCPIIFCSAYDSYLLDAFNTNGIAYILKPFTAKELSKALEKYESLFNTKEYKNINNSALTVLKEALREGKNSYKKRFVIKRNKGIQLLNIEDISSIEASGDFCKATDVKGNIHPISQNLSSILAQLPPVKFFRINRSQIVHIDAIERIENHFKNRLLISLIGNKEPLMTSSSTTSDFRKWLE